MQRIQKERYESAKLNYNSVCEKTWSHCVSVRLRFMFILLLEGLGDKSIWSINFFFFFIFGKSRFFLNKHTPQVSAESCKEHGGYFFLLHSLAFLQYNNVLISSCSVTEYWKSFCYNLRFSYVKSGKKSHLSNIWNMGFPTLPIPPETETFLKTWRKKKYIQTVWTFPELFSLDNKVIRHFWLCVFFVLIVWIVNKIVFMCSFISTYKTHINR